MEYLKKYEEKLKEGVEFATKMFEKNLLDTKYIKVVPAYVYFMKMFFEYKYELRKLELDKKNGDKMDFSIINKLGVNLNKAITALNTAHKNFGEKTSISLLKVKGGAIGIMQKNGSIDGGHDEGNFFYKIHKSKFKNWSAKTPREKIIKTLEVWTGERGQEAVLETIRNLQNDSELMFDYMLSLHNRQDLTNASISALYNNIYIQLYKYYIKHRQKYLGTVPDARKIKSNASVVKLALQDEFININIKLKMCDLRKFTPTVRNFIEALDKLDVKIMSKLVFLVQEGPVEGVDFRKLLKKRILEITNEIGEDIECIENPKTITETVKGDDIDSILKTVENFIEIEKKIEHNMKEIIEYNEFHKANIQKLSEALYELTGPDVRPCLLRIAPAIKAVIFSDDKYHKKNKLTTQGEKIIREMLSS